MQNKQAMHVLILSNPFPGKYQPLEGVFFRDQAFALAEQGIQTGHVSINPVSLRDVFKKGIRDLGLHLFSEKEVNSWVYRYIHMPKNTLQPLFKPRKKGMRLIEAYIRKHGKPDIVHVHRFETGLLAMELKSNYGIPFVITEHSSRFLSDAVPQNQKKWAKAIFTSAELRIAVSKSLKNTLEKTFEIPFHYLPNLTDTHLFTPGKKTGQPQFLSVGNLTKNKNQALAVEAFQLWINNNHSGRLVIVGAGPEESTLKEMVEQKKIGDFVEFRGQISREKLAAEMQKSSCLLISSRHETFGVVAIEALSAGIPVISTRCGGPESIIMEDVHGYFTDFSAPSLLEKMKQVWEHRDRFSAEKLHEYAEQEFSRQAIAQKLETIYHEVLETTDVRKS
jgi:glycosyltransferase involved in cell wall biosynthesis